MKRKTEQKENFSNLRFQQTEKVQDLEGIKEFQQDLIVEFEKVTGEELSKKHLPEWLANEIQRKKKKLSK